MSGQADERINRLMRRLLEIVEVCQYLVFVSLAYFSPIRWHHFLQVNAEPEQYSAALIRSIAPSFTVSSVAMT